MRARINTHSLVGIEKKGVMHTPREYGPRRIPIFLATVSSVDFTILQKITNPTDDQPKIDLFYLD